MLIESLDHLESALFSGSEYVHVRRTSASRGSSRRLLSSPPPSTQNLVIYPYQPSASHDGRLVHAHAHAHTGSDDQSNVLSLLSSGDVATSNVANTRYGTRAPHYAPPLAKQGLPRKPDSGTEGILEALKEIGDDLPPTWEELRREQLQLDYLLNLAASSHKVAKQQPEWWRPSPLTSVPDDTVRFDDRHQTAVSQATRALSRAVDAPADRLSDRAFQKSLDRVKRQRLVGGIYGLGGELSSAKDMQARAEEAARLRKIRNRWRLSLRKRDDTKRIKSIWSPRARASDSKGLFDTERCVLSMLEVDWQRSLRHGLGAYILRSDDEGDEAEIDDTRQALGQHAWLLYSSFDYLCSIGGGGVRSISSNGFATFIKEAGLADSGSDHCNQSHLDQLFIIINSQQEREAASGGGWASLRGATKGGAAAARTLERHEWLHALVRIAIMRYVLPGQRSVKHCADVSEALEALLLRDLVPNLPAELRQDSNEFRERHCYQPDVDFVLMSHESSLRAIFTAFGSNENVTGEADSHAHLHNRMSCEQWMDFVKDMSLIDKDLTERAAVLAFIWSRMKVIDERSIASQKKLAGLGFEDFLEALCRIAIMKAWPDDYDFKESGCKDGWQYVCELKANDPKTHAKLLKERQIPWNGEPWLFSHHCVSHLVCGLIRVIDTATSRNPNGRISLKEARDFKANRKLCCE